mmetsp:Transcript_10438/g.33742  ORF Transcript_10438/g.33742 Transcript_10438/m.33742 type:complete len:200 (-) Transcript_10438:106-705(-)
MGAAAASTLMPSNMRASSATSSALRARWIASRASGFSTMVSAPSWMSRSITPTRALRAAVWRSVNPGKPSALPLGALMSPRGKSSGWARARSAASSDLFVTRSKRKASMLSAAAALFLRKGRSAGYTEGRLRLRAPPALPPPRPLGLALGPRVIRSVGVVRPSELAGMCISLSSPPCPPFGGIFKSSCVGWEGNGTPSG